MWIIYTSNILQFQIKTMQTFYIVTQFRTLYAFVIVCVILHLFRCCIFFCFNTNDYNSISQFLLLRLCCCCHCANLWRTPMGKRVSEWVWASRFCRPRSRSLCHCKYGSPLHCYFCCCFMYVRMYVWTITSAHIYIHTYIFTTHLSIQTFISICMFVYIHVCTHTHIHTPTYTPTHLVSISFLLLLDDALIKLKHALLLFL